MVITYCLTFLTSGTIGSGSEKHSFHLLVHLVHQHINTTESYAIYLWSRQDEEGKQHDSLNVHLERYGSSYNMPGYLGVS